MSTQANQKSLVRATGLLVIEVVNSNPNGDPDNESDPRTPAWILEARFRRSRSSASCAIWLS